MLGENRDEDPFLVMFSLLVAHGAEPDARFSTTDAVDEVLGLLRARGDTFEQSAVLLGVGIRAWREGQLDQARSLVSQSLRLKRDLGDQVGQAVAVQVLAGVGASRGDAAAAAQLLGAADALWLASESSRTDHAQIERFADETRELVKAELGPPEFEVAYVYGTGLNPEGAVAAALDELRVSSRKLQVTLSPLTTREQEIAELVARGMTNRQVAASLVIAPRTAEGHVERILAKLGFTSRTQISNWVHERETVLSRLPPEPGHEVAAKINQVPPAA